MCTGLDIQLQCLKLFKKLSDIKFFLCVFYNLESVPFQILFDGISSSAYLKLAPKKKKLIMLSPAKKASTVDVLNKTEVCTVLHCACANETSVTT